MEFTHFDGKGNAVMVDVGDKAITRREATAQGEIGVSPECYEKIREGSMKKGDVLSVARIAFSWVATVLAAVVVSFPLMYRSAKAGFEQIDQNMIEEAKMLGLGKWGILWKILFPCTFPSILSGMILSTTRGLGEYGATAMLAGNIPGKTRTLPLAVYSEVAGGNMDRAAVYVAVILVIAFLSVWVMNMMAKTEQNIKI